MHGHGSGHDHEVQQSASDEGSIEMHMQQLALQQPAESNQGEQQMPATYAHACCRLLNLPYSWQTKLTRHVCLLYLLPTLASVEAQFSRDDSQFGQKRLALRQSQMLQGQWLLYVRVCRSHVAVTFEPSAHHIWKSHAAMKHTNSRLH